MSENKNKKTDSFKLLEHSLTKLNTFILDEYSKNFKPKLIKKIYEWNSHELRLSRIGSRTKIKIEREENMSNLGGGRVK